jgi:hypothetical protein
VSYDLYMLTPEPGVDPVDTLERLEESGRGPHDPKGEQRARRLAGAIRAADPRYELSEFEFEGATGVELSAENGLQITIMADHASVTFPYWDSLDTGRFAADIDKAAEIIAAETGWQLYDPQLEKLLDPVRDADELARAFAVGVGHVQRLGEEDARPSERAPWWRRVLGGD